MGVLHRFVIPLFLLIPLCAGQEVGNGTSPTTEPSSTIPTTEQSSITPTTEPSSTTLTTEQISTTTTEPSFTTPTTEPNPTTPTTEPNPTTPTTELSSTTEPSSTTPTTEPSFTTPSTEPSFTTSTTEPTSTTLTTEPDSNAPSTTEQSSTSTSTIESSSTTPTTELSSTTPTIESSSAAPTTESTSTTPTTEPNSNAPSTTEPSSTTPTTEPSSTISSTEPSSTTPTIEPSSTIPTTEPSSTTPTSEPSSTSPTTEPSSTTPNTEPSSNAPTTEPSSTVPTTEPTDISRTGRYILCVNLEGPHFRCGESVDITITVPTLSISTNLLILQYSGSVLVPGMDRVVLCSPSDPEAPIRWRASDTSFPLLPSDLGVTLTEMGQVLTLPEIYYEINPPDRTIVLVCDLQGSNIMSDEISPRNVTIRLLQNPVSILYQDREIPTPDAVINFFPIVSNTTQSILSLVCLSVYPNTNLTWERVADPNLMSETITSTTDGAVNVTYRTDIDSQQRLTDLSISPFTSVHSGTYMCRSGQSNSAASVYVTTRNPLFELVSPGMEYYPLGAEVTSLTVQYGDRSVGYMQQGSGFNYTLIFLPCVETLPPRVLLPHAITNRLQTNTSYSFQARLEFDNGEYLWNATHIDSGTRYAVSKNLTVIRPTFVGYDSSVFTLPGVNITLRCIPNDTRAPVIWSNFQSESGDLRNFPQSYQLSPPGLDQLLTFNTSVVFGPNPILNGRSQPQSIFSCGFVDGAERSPVFSNHTTLTLQAGRIEVRNIDRSNALVLNNTIINSFNIPRRKRRGASQDYIYESAPEVEFLGNLRLDCNGVQGDHIVSWYTDNSLVGLPDGRVNCDPERLNRQDIQSNYSSRLILDNLYSRINGNYTCRSSLSHVLIKLEIITSNPFIRRLSPAVITVDGGDTVTLGFQVAVNSIGSVWNQSTISFVFNNSNGISSTRRFNVLDLTQPQKYYLNIPSVQEADSGVYFASVLDELCNPEYGEINCVRTVTEEITLIVMSYCNQEITDGFLWPRTVEGSAVALSCARAGDSFRTETMATRQCLSGGIWSVPDLTTCTLKQDVDPFLLIWFVLDVGEVPDEEGKKVLEEEMKEELKQFNVMVNSVKLQSAVTASVSLSFEVTLLNPPSEQSEALAAYMNYLSNQFRNFSGIEVRENNRGLIGVSSATSCPCSGSSSGLTNSTILELCAGAPSSPCRCVNSTCQCMTPFVGDGDFCTLDTDDDTFPDQPLQSPTCSDASTLDSKFCLQDNCILVSNQDQNPIACESPDAVHLNNPNFDGCLLEMDSVWEVLWPNTPTGSISTQQCPGGLESLGKATRECNSSGVWQDPNVLSCESVQFAIIRAQADQAFSSSDPQVLVAQVAIITDELVRATTAPVTQSSTSSLLPLDLQTTVNLLSDILSILENYDVNLETTENVINVFNNVLHINNTVGWDALAQSQTVYGSEVLLFNAERYGLSLAKSQLLNGSPLRLSRPNIAISASMFNQSVEVTEADLQFPVTDDLVNFSSNLIPLVSKVPPEYVNTILRMLDENASVPVSHIIFMNLDEYLQPSTLNKSNVTSVASIIYSIQVGDRSLVNNKPSVFRSNPLILEFTFDQHENVSGYNCTFWDFSEPIGTGGFSKAGVITKSNVTMDNRTTVQCLSDHLTSFAVLVDVAGVITTPGEQLALQIVSYIGCAVSIICLTLSVIFFIFQRKKLFKSLNYFIHLNLSLSLLMAFVVFVLGIELGTSTKGGCLFVALLLHYLFLSAFCWMLCEGIVLYFLLVAIFNKNYNKWWIYMLIGYVAPLPVVIISVASRFDYYGVRGPNDELIYCWLSVEQGTIFAFVAPMMVIIIVNIVFLVLGLHSLWKNRKRGGNPTKKKTTDTSERVKSLLLASLVLLPLLGLTWAFGILTINSNTTVFAWLFTIFNSFQGLAIFFFHVVRNEKIWSKISRKSTKRMSSSSRAKWYSRSSGQTVKGTFKSQDPSSGHSLNTLNGASTLKKTDMTSISMDDEVKQDLSIVDSMASPDDTIISNECTPFPEYKSKNEIEMTSKGQGDVHDSEVILNADAVNIETSTLEHEGPNSDGIIITNKDAVDTKVLHKLKQNTSVNDGETEHKSSNADPADNSPEKYSDTDDHVENEDERISKL